MISTITFPLRPNLILLSWVLCFVFVSTLFCSALAQGVMIDTAKIVASDGQSYDDFGNAIAVSGDVIVVGSKFDDDLGWEAGSVYVYRFEQSSGLWKQEAKLYGSDSQIDDNFGHCVSVNGDRILVGAPYHDSTAADTGATYIFRYDAQTQSWNEEKKLIRTNSVTEDWFGFSVDIAGDMLVIGVPGDDTKGNQAGAAEVYRYDPGSLDWVLLNTFIPSDIMNLHRFGHAVAVSGFVVAIGCPGDDANGWMAGSVYVFRYRGAGQWLQEDKLFAPQARVEDYFGSAVDATSNLIIAGSYGNDDDTLGDNVGGAFIFRYDPIGLSWSHESSLLPVDVAPNDWVGYSVGIDSNYAVISAHYDDDNGNYSGSAYLFKYDEVLVDWVEENKLLPSDGAMYDEFGMAVAISGDRIVAGAHLDDDSGADCGSAYIFDLNPQYSLFVDKDPLEPGNVATFTVKHGMPNKETYLGYSLAGMGFRFIPALDVTINLALPTYRVGGVQLTDSTGRTDWIIAIPISQPPGTLVWFQSLQYGQATNVIATSIQ